MVEKSHKNRQQISYEWERVHLVEGVEDPNTGDKPVVEITRHKRRTKHFSYCFGIVKSDGTFVRRVHIPDSKAVEYVDLIHAAMAATKIAILNDNKEQEGSLAAPLFQAASYNELKKKKAK